MHSKPFTDDRSHILLHREGGEKDGSRYTVIRRKAGTSTEF